VHYAAQRKRPLAACSPPRSGGRAGLDVRRRHRAQPACIDRSFVADGARWIIDYKTARLPESELADRAESHRPQLERYARLFAGDPLPVRLAIYFPLQGRLVELPLNKFRAVRRYGAMQMAYTVRSSLAKNHGMLRCLLLFLLALGLSARVAAESGQSAVLRVLVPTDAAPMAYYDESGRLTGFSVEVLRALCAEIRASCQFDVANQEEFLDRLQQGKADLAASGVFEMPELRGKLPQANPYYRSLSLGWPGRMCRPGVPACGLPSFRARFRRTTPGARAGSPGRCATAAN
jgi:hypothetical protein